MDTIEKNELMTCKCGNSDIRHNMWHNPISKDIKCDRCFLDCLTTCIKEIKEERGLRKIKRRIFGINYPKIITEYYKGTID